jgi:mRNA interferase MazF
MKNIESQTMSHYAPGDIILAPFPHDHEGSAKVRPAIVITINSDGDLCCCPIRSTPRTGSTCIPISIDDFDEGGLDLFSESYVQTDTVRTIKRGAVIGKKGHVSGEMKEMIEKLILQHLKRTGYT